MYRLVFIKENVQIIITIPDDKLPEILLDAVKQHMKIKSLDNEVSEVKYYDSSRIYAKTIVTI